MSGGLRHRNDDETAEPCGWISIIERRGTAPYALPGNVCPNLQKPKANSLDTSDVVRDVVNRWDERPVSGRDAIGSQVIDALEAQEMKETGNEEVDAAGTAVPVPDRAPSKGWRGRDARGGNMGFIRPRPGREKAGAGAAEPK